MDGPRRVRPLRCVDQMHHLTHMLSLARAEHPDMPNPFPLVAGNFVLGILFAALLVAFFWWIGHYWLSATKILVAFVSVLIAYKSLFPIRTARPEN